MVEDIKGAIYRLQLRCRTIFQSSKRTGKEVKKSNSPSMFLSSTATAESINKECLKRQSSKNSKYVIFSHLSKLVPYQYHVP